RGPGDRKGDIRIVEPTNRTCPSEHDAVGADRLCIDRQRGFLHPSLVSLALGDQGDDPRSRGTYPVW
ncbi:MAG: hypothetical protein WAL38_03340, partial [Solirubrobacteraceae bacterium]